MFVSSILGISIASFGQITHFKKDVLFVQMVIIFKYSNNLLFRVMDHKMFWVITSVGE